jgi:hypothetical protein
MEGLPEAAEEVLLVSPASRRERDTVMAHSSDHNGRVVAELWAVARMDRQAQHRVVNLIGRLGQRPGHVAIGGRIERERAFLVDPDELGRGEFAGGAATPLEGMLRRGAPGTRQSTHLSKAESTVNRVGSTGERKASLATST